MQTIVTSCFCFVATYIKNSDLFLKKKDDFSPSLKNIGDKDEISTVFKNTSSRNVYTSGSHRPIVRFPINTH